VFWAWLARLWPGWHAALAFVQPGTVIAWQRKRCRDYWRYLSQQGTPGRPALTKEVLDLIRALWQANPTWDSPRIVGELRKVGINVAKSTVEKYRPRVHKPSSPTWKTFLYHHVHDIVACDFFLVPTSTYRVLFVFIMLAHERRLHRISMMSASAAMDITRTSYKGCTLPHRAGSVFPASAGVGG
jgi:hypothetical protein